MTTPPGLQGSGYDAKSSPVQLPPRFGRTTISNKVLYRTDTVFPIDHQSSSKDTPFRQQRETGGGKRPLHSSTTQTVRETYIDSICQYLYNSAWTKMSNSLMGLKQEFLSSQKEKSRAIKSGVGCRVTGTLGIGTQMGVGDRGLLALGFTAERGFNSDATATTLGYAS